MTPELYIEPLVTIADLLLAIGLIGLGLSIGAIIITVEIYYFRGGKYHGKTGAQPERSIGSCRRIGAYYESLGSIRKLPGTASRAQMAYSRRCI